MSQRGKRQPNRSDDGPVVTKRRKCRPSAAEEETASIANDGSGSWTPRPLTDLKMPSIYNRSTTEAPAELFRKDLISAMKLPDSEPLATDEYWIITDQWKQEWERGVQVPVNPDSLPEPTVTVNHCAKSDKAREFKLPKSKYIRITKDENFTSENHFLSTTPAKAEKACAYDLDDCDAAWLRILNGERAQCGLPPVTGDQLERVMEELEVRCWEKVQTIVKTEEGLGIEYDENVICDVCRSPDSEEGNEMVFCDCCNICVHQACYGITTIPSGSWLCRTCALGQRPECVLCPNTGGAMKCTRSGQKWAHVSCALWIPEVSIGCVERMEPITKISSIPQSRWALICVLCRERVGACIQCSVKTCKTAYHVTCAFKHGLEMRAIIEDENADDGVKLRSYCQKHSVTSKKERCGSQSEEDESKRRKRKDMTSEEKNQARAAKLHEIEAEFDKHVSVKDVTQPIDVDPEGIQYIYNYWKLKRKAGFNRPLLPPKSEDADMLSHQQEQADIEKMKMFVQLRQDLERVRNLCYMVSRREKLSRSFFRMREQTFHKQAAVLGECSLKNKEIAAVIAANRGPSIYDRLYSQPSTATAASDADPNSNFELVLARIAGTVSPPPPPPSDDKPKTVDLNGLVKYATDRKGDKNPYKRVYFNGATRRRSSMYGSMSSESESDALRRSPSKKLLGLPNSASSSLDEDEDDKAKRSSSVRDKSVSGKTKTVVRKKSKKSVVVSRTKVDTTSEEDEKPSKSAWQGPRSRTLRQMEREMASATDDSDELMPIKVMTNEPQKRVAIYSDSDSEVSVKGEATDEDRNEDKSSTPGDQPFLRTKAAMKEFSAGLQAKSAQKNNPKLSKNAKKPKERDLQDDSMDDDSTKDKENVKSSKKSDYVPSDLIVPQRQAAKKASESMRFSHGKNKDQVLVDQETFKATSPLTPVSDEPKVKQRLKHKSKDLKEPRTPGKSNDIYDFEKETTSFDEAAEILAYVPQRQAAKKAALHIKSGMTKPVQPGEGDGKEVPDITKSKKDLDGGKGLKRDSEGEKSKSVKSPDSKGKTLPRPLLSSSSSSSSSGDSSSSSDSDSDGSKTKSPLKEKVVASEKKIAPVSPLKDSGKKSKQATGIKTSEDWPFLDKGDQSSRSSSSSCGSDSSDSDMFTRKKEIGGASQKVAVRNKSKELDDKKGGSASKLVGKKFKKAPDKKLKTSDRRPELEFQPPVTERDEPPKPKESLGKGRKSDGHKATRTDEGDRLRNVDGRPRAVPLSKSRCSDDSSSEEADSYKRECNATAGGRNQPRTTRAEEQSKRGGPDLERRGGNRKDESKGEGRARKSGDSEGSYKSAKVHGEAGGLSGSSDGAAADKSRKEARKSREESAVPKKTDKKVSLANERGDKKPLDKVDRDNLATRVEKESDKALFDRKSSRVSDKLSEQDSKTEKLLNKKHSAHETASPVKSSSVKDDSLKLKHSSTNASRKKASPSREISQKKANRLVDLFEPEEVKRKEKVAGFNQDIKSSPDKHNSLASPSDRLSAKESNQRITSTSRLSKQQDSLIASPKRDRRTSAAVVNEVPAEKDVRRDSTESVASVSTEYGDDKSRKKGKAMPRCKKQELEILSSGEESREDKTAASSKDDMQVETQQNVNTRLTRDKSAQNNNSLKRSLSPDHLLAKAANETVGGASSRRSLPSASLDHEHDFLAPDPESTAEPRKITSRTPSLTGAPCPQRSIFSPQQPKDPAAAELFDFENDILAVDETVNDDGFSMARDTEELMRPLTFSFGSDFLFKEESKEDSERETLNLVEKLRLQYAQKSTTGQPDAAETPDAAVDDDNSEAQEPPEEKPEPVAEVVAEPIVVDVKEDEVLETSAGRGPNSMESTLDIKSVHAATPIQDVPMDVQEIEKMGEQPYSRADNYDGSYVPVEAAKASIPSLEKLDRTNSGQADERWVPPSMEFVQQGQQQQQQQHLHYESHVQPIETPAQSPYTDHRARAKWADSEVLPVRRSSSSSGSSSSSSSHREDVEPMKREDFLFPHNPADLYQGMHPGIPAFPPCSINDVHGYHPYSEASQFVGPVALFPSACAQLPFPSPGVGMYPTPFGPPFTSAHQLMPQKPPEELPHIPPPCSAAFTSSSHNMALITAMVSQPPQTPTPILPPSPPPVAHPQLPHTLATFPSAPESVSPANNNMLNHAAGKDSPTPKTTAIAAGKKSPTKPTRTSARVTSQLSKSPGKSPRQQEPVVAKSPARSRDSSAGAKRGKGSAGRGQNRGGNRRGRGRGRGHNMHYQDMDHNTIHSKLAGTVYDLEFDDDSPTDSVESMRAMRERRRSTDVHEKKASSEYDTSSMSPKFGSPSGHQTPLSSHNSKMRCYSTDVRDLRPPTPLSSAGGTPARDEDLMPPPSPVPPASVGASVDRSEHFPDVVVRPLLPGPVDMRTYSSLYEPNPANNPAAYHNHVLGQYATADAEQHVTDFVEDLEKELHTALAASKTSSMLEIAKESDIGGQIAADNGHVSQMKVSMSDSRNQLKFKIKGPFLDANYSACSVPTLPQHQTPAPVPPLDVMASSNTIPIAATTAVFSAASSSGISSLRRMRKKELLRQYCSQDMNINDPAGGAVIGQAAAPTAAPPINRTIITIPKAVASMTTIPTREDYKAVVDANMEKKRRKEKSATLSNALSGPRELRHLDLDLDACMPERRRSAGSTGSNASSIQDSLSSSAANKLLRRGRPPKPADCPVLKIKISSGQVAKTEVQAIDDKKLKVGLRPPKKRLSSVPMPSMEDMKRESMKFRKLIIKDFKGERKKQKSKPGERKKEKKKRHREAQNEEGNSMHEVRIITDESAEKSSTPKLIIRFNKRLNVNSSAGDSVSPASEKARTVVPPVENAETKSVMPPPEVVPTPVLPVAEPDPSKQTSLEVPTLEANGAKKGPSPLLKVRASKVTPIRLKLARCNEGYVMKTPPADPLSTDSPAAVPLNDSEQALKNSSSVLVNAGCEVR